MGRQGPTGGALPGQSRPKGANTPAAAAQKRTATSSGRRGRATAGGGGAGGILQFYTDEAPGLKIGPTTVLIGSLVFIGCVVLLHIWGKFRK